MIQRDRVALAVCAREVSASLARLADALDDDGDDGADRPYGPATVNLLWSERLLRQSLILRDIIDAGGTVDRATWYTIAANYGYRGRGLAGFFRANARGLLAMDKNGRVSVTARGHARLEENQRRLDDARLR